MSESIVTKHVRLIQREIARTGEMPESHVVGSWQEWHALRDEVKRLAINTDHPNGVIYQADSEFQNFLLCGVPCVPEPVPITWDRNHILILLP